MKDPRAADLDAMEYLARLCRDGFLSSFEAGLDGCQRWRVAVRADGAEGVGTGDALAEAASYAVSHLHHVRRPPA